MSTNKITPSSFEITKTVKFLKHRKHFANANNKQDIKFLINFNYIYDSQKSKKILIYYIT